MLYRALADSGAEVEMLAYPREPHGFREPAHTQHMLEAWAAWYQAYGLWRPIPTGARRDKVNLTITIGATHQKTHQGVSDIYRVPICTTVNVDSLLNPGYHPSS